MPLSITHAIKIKWKTREDLLKWVDAMWQTNVKVPKKKPPWAITKIILYSIIISQAQRRLS